MATITDNDLDLFRKRAKTELKSTGDIGRLAWDDVVEALCKEIARLRSVSKERGEASKLREAMKAIRKEVYLYAIEEDKQDFAHLHEAMLDNPPEYKDLRNSFFAIAHLVDAALAEPVKNCEVGTAEEQIRRWKEDCSKDRIVCGSFMDCGECALRWA